MRSAVLQLSLISQALLASALFWPNETANAETYGYDRAGRLIQVSYESGQIIRYNYDDNSNILSAQIVSDALFADGFEQ